MSVTIRAAAHTASTMVNAECDKQSGPSAARQQTFSERRRQNYGERREVPEYGEEEAFLDSIGAEMGEINAKYKEILGPEKYDATAEEDMEHAIQGRINEEEDTRDITMATNDLENLIAKIKALSDKEVVTEDDKKKIREILFNIKPNPEILKFRRDRDSRSFEDLDPEDVPPDPSNIQPGVIPRFEDSIAWRSPSKNSEAAIGGTGIDFDIPLRHFPESFRPYIRALVANLQRIPGATSEENRKLRRTLWRSYLMCRSALVSMPSRIPRGFWSHLWMLFSKDDSTNYVDRMAHIMYLGEDMQKANTAMDLSQKFLYLEALLVHGNLEVAERLWKSCEGEAKAKGRSGESFELGVKLFCRKGEPNRALELANKRLSGREMDGSAYRILLPILQTCLAINKPSSIQMAWEIYCQLRIKLGSEMKIGDWDTITMSFLEADRSNMALATFKDMMLKPNTKIDHKSTEVYHPRDSKNGLSVKVDTPVRLPSEFNNKFFFGSWIKKLLGDGEIDAAKKVFDLMADRGMLPDARHVNGFIGACIREGTQDRISLAEDIAWKMISRRLDIVSVRRAPSDLEAPLRAIDSTGKPAVKSLALYRRRQQDQSLTDLVDVMRRSEITPNTAFMNEMLSVDAKNVKNDGWMWEKYQSLSAPHERLKVARSLFSEMIKHKSRLRKAGPLPKEVYDYIILGFSLAEDQPGTAVALNALRVHFSLRNAATQARIEKVTKVFQQLKKARDEALLQQGTVFDNLSEEEKSREALIVLTELLRHAFQTKTETEERKLYTVSVVCEKAAEQMSVPECATWAPS
ncbi:putative Pentatricopeptide repeat-containing protein, mitochondrial [Glarea lozoyensis 74030]|uniref:Putative Pentatricopeptide repeat-containing protein, mitochondrial n=1 Tax=Glarea lozoyensis (strain ATCC 74030 / MF5533) TaxID=1104152 RepID=H0EDW8_GLAL7|nr:putative Pentatricopeptide repeat-containing protein, mitochondrial [Glarea lozoyensis 74030]